MSIGELLGGDLSNGRSVRTAKSGFPVLRLTALRNGRVDLRERKIGEWSAEDATPYLVEKDHFFVARGNGSIRLVGLGGLVEEEPDPVAYPDTMIRLGLPTQVVDPRFFAFQWNSPGLRRQIEPLAKTTAGIYKINQGDIARCEIVVPPLREQGAIASCLGEQLSKIDAAIAGLKRVQANLKRYRASVLKAAVEGRLVPTEAELAREEGRDYEPASVLLGRILAERRRRWEEAELAKMKAKGKTPKNDTWKAKYKEPAPPDTDGLPELPEGWCWTTIESIIREPLRNGHSSPADKSGGGVPTLTLTAVTTGDFENNIKLTSADPDKVTDLWLEREDIFVQRSNAPHLVGTSKMFEGESNIAIFPDLLIRLRVAHTVFPRFVEAVLQSHRVRRYFRCSAGGSAGSMPKISQGTIADLVIPLPPASEQARIAEHVRAVRAEAHCIAQSAVRSVRRSERLRQSILKWAFEGKLVDQDPNDEPASVLLDRIRAEREAGAQRPKKAKATKKKTTKKKAARKRSAKKASP